MRKSLVYMGTLLFLGGCSSQYAVTYDSYPQGATLVCNGTNWGYTPVTLYYDKSVKEKDYLNLGACSANWVSGVRKTYGIVPVSQYPEGVRQTLQRPDGPNANVDHSFALQVLQARQMNQVLQNTQAIQDEQERVKQQKEQEDNTQYLCNLGLLNHPGCK
ncbi:hypothetical protein [Rheinheimera sp.]|uniref:hypothetical protein n=1 Tax=Rheinheimera sp. TaxID=1869214 RepID=UPI003AF78955